MERFEIRAVRGGKPRRLVITVQHPFVENLDTCVVAPLEELGTLLPIENLRPVLTFDDRSYVVVMDRLAAADRRQLGPVLDNVPDQQDVITRALDLPFVGF